MKVSELIDHLKTMNPDLEVWYAARYDCYHQVQKEKIQRFQMKDSRDERIFDVCMFGDVPC
jgi:hypothetical protein